MANLELINDIFETINGLNEIGLMTDDDMRNFEEMRLECLENNEDDSTEVNS